MTDKGSTIRDAIFEHEMFEADRRGNNAFTLEHIRKLEATWPFAANEIENEIDKMALDGLVSMRDGAYWYATYDGQIARETRWQNRGLRHLSLSINSAKLRDLIIALLRSAGGESELWTDSSSLPEPALGIYLFQTDTKDLVAAIQELIAEGLVKQEGHFLVSDVTTLRLTSDGIRHYAQTVVPRLGLIPPTTILAADTPEGTHRVAFCIGIRSNGCTHHEIACVPHN